MVGVGENAAALTPGIGPQHAVHVAKQAHQLGDADRRVRIVEVDRDLIGQIVQGTVLFEVMEDDVLQRGRNEEIFLTQTQFASGRRTVVRIQHPGNVFKAVLELGGASVIAGIEGVEVDLRRRIGLPQAQRADPLGTMTGDHIVVSIGLDGFGSVPLRPFAIVFGGTAEMHGEMRAGAAEFPDVLLHQPVIRVLDLAAIDNRLGKHAVFVTHAIAPGGQLQRRHRIEEAGRQTSQTAVTERRIRLALDDLCQGRRAFAGEHLLCWFTQVKRRKRVIQSPPDQELHRQVINPPRFFRPVFLLGLHPALGELGAADQTERGIHFFRIGGCRIGGDAVKQSAVDVVTQLLGFGDGGRLFGHKLAPGTCFGLRQAKFRFSAKGVALHKLA